MKLFPRCFWPIAQGLSFQIFTIIIGSFSGAIRELTDNGEKTNSHSSMTLCKGLHPKSAGFCGVSFIACAARIKSLSYIIDKDDAGRFRKSPDDIKQIFGQATAEQGNPDHADWGESEKGDQNCQKGVAHVTVCVKLRSSTKLIFF